MKYINHIYKTLRSFSRQLTLDHVNAYAAQSSFFVIIAMFPLLMLLLSLIRYTPVTEQVLVESTLAIMPNTLDPLIVQIISEMYGQADFAIISITAVTALWSASKAILALIRGLNSVFGIDEKRNYFHLRIVASFYTIIFLLLIVLSLGFMVFGNSLLRFFSNNVPLLYELAELIISLRGLYIPIIFTIAFVYLYRIVPNRDYTFFDHLPGALFSSLGWIIFSYVYSFYIDNFAGSTYFYGSLTTVVLLMLWIYICMYILFVGAEINIQFKEYFRKARQRLKEYHDNDTTP